MFNKKRMVCYLVFIVLMFFLMTFAGSPVQNAPVATRQVTFTDGYNGADIMSYAVEVGKAATVPEDPYHENFIFTGWYQFDNHSVKVTDFSSILEDTHVIALYADDINNNGIADDLEDKYTVRFFDTISRTTLKTEEVLPGMNATAPLAPTHVGYNFGGWSRAYTNVNSDITVNTIYNAINNNDDDDDEVTTYTVTFIDGEDQSTISTETVNEGASATTPEVPKHEGRVFDYWDGNYSNVQKNETVTAVYTDDKNHNEEKDYLEDHFTVKFTTDGRHGSLSGDKLEYNEILTGLTFEEAGITVPTPVPESDKYHANDWDPTIVTTVTDNATYNMTFSPNNDENHNGDADEDEDHFTVEFVVDGEHGTLRGQAKFENILTGLTFEEAGITVPTPVAENDNYNISDWDPAIVTTVTSDATYKVKFTPKNDENHNGDADEDEDHFTVEFVVDGEHGTLTGTTKFENILTGLTFEEAGITVPTPVAENDNYNISEWDPTIVTTVTADATYKVKFTPKNDENHNGDADEDEDHFTVEFVVDGEHGTLRGQAKFENILTGLTFEEAGITVPTPVAENDNYNISDWDPAIVTTVTSDATYKVKFTPKNDENHNGDADEDEDHFTVEFTKVGEHGSLRGTTKFENILTGLTFEEAGITVPTPVAENDNYNISEWDPAIVTTVTADATYTVTFSPKNDENHNGDADEDEDHFTVEFVVDGEHGSLRGTTKFENILTGLTFEEAGITVPTPVAENDNYNISEWDPAIITTVTADAIYKVKFTPKNDENHNGDADEDEDHFTVEFVVDGEHGTLTGTTKFENILTGLTFEEAGITVPTPVAENDNYNISEWDPTIVTTVTDNATYKVKFTPKNDENQNGDADEDEDHFTIKFEVDGEHGTLTGTTKFENILTGLEFGDVVTVPTVVADQYYHANDWTPAIPADNSKVTTDATYTITFSPDHDENGPEGHGDGIADEDQTYTLIIDYQVSEGEEPDGFPADQTIPRGYDERNYNIDSPVVTHYTANPTNVSGTIADDHYLTKTETVVYSPIKFTVTFKVDGETVKTQQVIEGSAATAPEDPAKENYEFAGWDKAFDNIIADTEVTATFTPVEFNITYDLAGGTISSTAANPSTYTVESNITLVNPTREGYAFAGWTGTGLTEATETVTIPVGSTGDRSYTATWTANDTTYTVEYYTENAEDDDYSLYSTEDIDAQVADSVSIEEITIEGFTFNENNNDNVLNGTVPATGKLTLKRYYSRNTYTLTLTKNDYVDTVTGAGTYKYGQSIIINATLNSQEGYTYSWVNWESNNTELLADQADQQATITVPAGSLTLQAIAQRVLITYTIAYDLVGGSVDGTNPAQYNVESQPITLVNPTKAGYTFAGWTGTGLTEATETVTIPTGSTGNRSYTATYTADEFTIAYDLAGGTVTGNPTTYTIDTPSFTLVNPTREGYTFAGWTGTGIGSTATTVTVAQGSTGNRSYTATWQKNSSTLVVVNGDNSESYTKTYEETQTVATPSKSDDVTVTTYNITLNSNGGSAVSNMTANKTDTTSYEFTGWTESEPFYGEFNDETSVYTFGPENGTTSTLTAGFTSTDSTETQTITLPTPTREGYDFLGWYEGETKVENSLTPTRNMDLVAKWEIKKYTVTFKVDGEQYGEVQTVNHGSDATAPADPTKTNYTFTGWDKDFSNVTSNLTVNAEFEANLIRLDAATKPNKSLQYEQNEEASSGVLRDIKDDIVVTAVYADGATEVLGNSDYTTDFDITTVTDGRKTLTISYEDLTNTELTYIVSAHEVVDSKFDVTMSVNNKYLETKSSSCRNNCNVAPKVKEVTRKHNFLEVTEHYDERITIETVKVKYVNENTEHDLYILKSYDNGEQSARWSRKNTNGIYDPTKIVYPRNKNESPGWFQPVTDDWAENSVLPAGKEIDKVIITYTKQINSYTTKRYRIVFDHTPEGEKEFTAISEEEI